MPAPRKYSDEVKARAVRLTIDALADPATKHGAYKRIAAQLDLNTETLRSWVRQAQIDTGERPGTTTSESERITELEKEVRELRRANEILKSASAFFAAELDRPSR